MRDFVGRLGADHLHVIAVCQPAAPVLVATALMAAEGETQPRSLPPDGRFYRCEAQSTPANDFANSHSLRWFENDLIDEVPFPYPGHADASTQGFLQHAGFMALNPVRHFRSYWDFYMHLVEGDLEGAEEHRRFYDEYNAVLICPPSTISKPHPHHLHEICCPADFGPSRRACRARGITRTALLTIEGERDDISASIKPARHTTFARPSPPRANTTYRPGTGHYGIFSGRRWRELVYPQIRDFIAAPTDPPASRRRLAHHLPDGAVSPVERSVDRCSRSCSNGGS